MAGKLARDLVLAIDTLVAEGTFDSVYAVPKATC
jgi:hypothetical protein